MTLYDGDRIACIPHNLQGGIFTVFKNNKNISFLLK